MNVGRSFLLAVFLLGAIPFSTVALAQGLDPDGRRRLTFEQVEQLRPLFTLVEEAAAGKPVPSAAALTWQYHFVKAASDLVVVPFTIKIDKGLFTSFPLAMYVRVVYRGDPAPAPGPRDALAQYPFEDATVFDEPTDGRISRAFSAPAGPYDVYVALREKPDLNVPEPKVVVLKQQVDVPDLTSDLAVSSIIVADKIEAAPAGPERTFEDQLDGPYTLWGYRITPTIGSDFSRSRVLSLIFLVYNAGTASGDKPDVEIEYAFYRRTVTAEQFFNRLQPQSYNAQTLKPDFSVAAGHFIMGGADIPLARFLNGNYRLEIKVTDKTNGRTLTRDVNFIVVGP